MLTIDPRDHRLCDGLRAEARALQVDVQHVVPLALRHFEEWDAGEHRGVVDQDVDRAEPLLGGRHHRLHLFHLADICLDQNRPPSAGAYLIRNTLGGPLIIEPVDRDVGACGSKL